MKDHGGLMEVVQEVDVVGRSYCSWPVVQSADREKKTEVYCSCIRHRSIGQCRDEIVAMLAVGISKGDLLKQSEVAVVAASAAFDMVGTHFGWFGAEAQDREGHSLVVGVEEAVHFVLQLDVDAELEEVVVGGAQVRVESLAATGRCLHRHSRCHHTRFEMAALAAL